MKDFDGQKDIWSSDCHGSLASLQNCLCCFGSHMLKASVRFPSAKDEMLARTVETNTVSRNSAISAQTRWQLAIEMLSQHLDSCDVVTFNAGITSLEKASRWKDASSLVWIPRLRQ